MAELQRQLLRKDYIKLCESGRAQELGLHVLSPDNHTIIWSFKISHNSPTSRWSSIEYEVEIIFKRFPFEPPIIKFPCSSINRKNPKHPLLDAEGILRCDFLNDLCWKPSVTSLEIVNFVETIFSYEEECQTELKAAIEPSVMLLVLHFLPIEDILSVSRTSKAMFCVCNAEELWTYLLFHRSKLANSFIYTTNFGPLRVYQSHGESEGKFVWQDTRETFIKAYEAHMYSQGYPAIQEFILNELPVITTMSYTSPFTGLKSLFSLIDGIQEGQQQQQQVSEEMKARLLQILRYRCRRYSRLGRWVYGSSGLKKQLEYFDKDGVPVTTLLFLAAVSLQEGIRNETFFGDWILHFYASNETNNMEEQYCIMPGRRFPVVPAPVVERVKATANEVEYNKLLSRCYYEIAMMETKYQPPANSMENVYCVNNEVIEATSIDAMDRCASLDGSQPMNSNDDVTATGPDIYDFLEAYHESCLAISQEFRDFRTKHIVDAMDCHGNWIAATIDSHHYTHPQGVGLIRSLPNFVTAVPKVSPVGHGIHHNTLQTTVRGVANQSRRFLRGKANLVKRKLTRKYEHEIDSSAYFHETMPNAHEEARLAMQLNIDTIHLNALNAMDELNALDAQLLHAIGLVHNQGQAGPHPAHGVPNPQQFQELIAVDNQAPPGQEVAAVAGPVPDVTGVAAPIPDVTGVPIPVVTGGAAAPIPVVTGGAAAPIPVMIGAPIPVVTGVAGPIPGVPPLPIPRLTRVAPPTSSVQVPAVFSAIDSKEIRDNGLPSPYHASRNIRTSMLGHSAFLVMQVFGNLQRGVYCEDKVQAILDNDRRLDMVNEGKKEARKHLLDPNQVMLGLPGESNLEKRCFLTSSFPESEFTNSNGIECCYPPVKFGYRSPDDRWVQRVAVAVPDVNEVLPIAHPLPTNPPGYVYIESSGCSKPLQSNAYLSFMSRRLGPYDNFNFARAFSLHRAVTVHFLGFDDRFNEQLAVSSWRIAPFRAKSSRPISMAMLAVKSMYESLNNKRSWSCNIADTIEISVRCFWLMHRPGAGLLRVRVPRSIKLVDIINDYCTVMQLKNKKLVPSIICMETAVKYLLYRRHGVPFVEKVAPDDVNTWHGAQKNTPGVRYMDPAHTLRQAGICHDDILDLILLDAKYDSI